MALKTVYSPDGEMFEIIEERANLLVLNEGWTQIKPEKLELSVKETKPASKTRRKAKPKKGPSFLL